MVPLYQRCLRTQGARKSTVTLPTTEAHSTKSEETLEHGAENTIGQSKMSRATDCASIVGAGECLEHLLQGLLSPMISVAITNSAESNLSAD